MAGTLMRAMRESIKHVFELLQLRAGPALIARRATRGRSLVLAYHNIVPDGATLVGDRSLHLARGEFARQLDVLTRDCQVVPLSALMAVSPASDERPRVVITLDDAYHGALTLGVDELTKRGLPATIFVAPGFLGRCSFWWDTFADPSAPEPLADLRTRALQELRGTDQLVRHWAERNGFSPRPLPEHAQTAHEDELRRALSRPGITLGSHSWGHPNLAKLTPSELSDELQRPLEWLSARFGHAVLPWLSYPYGSSSRIVASAAAAAGYDGAFAIGGGWFRPREADRYLFPRLNVPAGLSLNGFVLRLAGLHSR